MYKVNAFAKITYKGKAERENERKIKADCKKEELIIIRGKSMVILLKNTNCIYNTQRFGL